MDYLPKSVKNDEDEPESHNQDLSLTKEEYDRKSINFRMSLQIKKQGLQQYRESQESGALFENTLSPL